MNRYGMVMEEMGMRDWCDRFVKEYFSVLGKVMAPHEPALDHHHTFVVEYREESEEKDRSLNVHVDDAELTLNLCLGEDGFEGGELFFRGHLERPHTHLQYEKYEHCIGKAIVHDGKHMHGAKPLRKGERYNLILWARSSEFRNDRKHIVPQIEEAKRQFREESETEKEDSSTKVNEDEKNVEESRD